MSWVWRGASVSSGRRRTSTWTRKKKCFLTRSPLKRDDGPGPVAGAHPPAKEHMPERRGMAGGQPLLMSRLAERDGDELGGIAGLHPHQHRALAVLVQARKLLAHVFGLRHRLAGDIEDHVAGFDAMLCGGAVGIDPPFGAPLIARGADTLLPGDHEPHSPRSRCLP